MVTNISFRKDFVYKLICAFLLLLLFLLFNLLLQVELKITCRGNNTSPVILMDSNSFKDFILHNKNGKSLEGIMTITCCTCDLY